jgi:hypothetical protein
MSTSDPTPVTHFEAWGQAVYKAKDNLGGLCVLFAISEASREWLAWYIYTDRNWLDPLVGAPHEVLGEGSAHALRFTRDKPMRVDELCGPYMYSRGGPNNLEKTRTAVLEPGPHHPRSHVIDIRVYIQPAANVSDNVPSDSPIHLHIKRKQGEFVLDKFRFGKAGFIMTEPFKYPTPHLDVTQRLRTFEYNITR